MPKKYKIVTFILFFLKRNSNYCVSVFILLVSTAKTNTLTLRWKRNNELKCTYLFPTDYKNIWSNGEVKKIKILCHILPFLFWILDNINRIWGQIKKKKRNWNLHYSEQFESFDSRSCDTVKICYQVGTTNWDSGRRQNENANKSFYFQGFRTLNYVRYL